MSSKLTAKWYFYVLLLGPRPVWRTAPCFPRIRLRLTHDAGRKIKRFEERLLGQFLQKRLELDQVVFCHASVTFGIYNVCRHRRDPVIRHKSLDRFPGWVVQAV